MKKIALPIMVTSLLFCLLMLTACNNGDGHSNASAPPYDGGGSVAAKTKVILPGSDTDCPNGGVLVETGIDVNGNGLLDLDEVTNSEKICSGSSTLIDLTDEPAGDNCVNGGIKIEVGLDASGDGILDADEITATDYVCNGEVLVGGAPQTMVFPVNTSTLNFLDGIVLTFSEPMDSTSLVLGGDLGPESNGGEWTSFYTVKLSPLTSGWSPGSNRTLIVDAADLNGNPITQLSLGYNVKKVLYVKNPQNPLDLYGGNDSNPGTKDEPLASIGAAIAIFKSASTTGEIHVSQGNYEVDYQLGTHIQLIDGLLLYGGYSRSDWDVRDPSVYVSTISDISTFGSISGIPASAVYAGAGVTSSAIVDGFTINGGGYKYASAVFIEDGGAPTIQNNIINGGSGSDGSDYSYGIYNKSSSPTIEKNIISGGSGITVSNGIFHAISSSPTIQNNIIDGGSGASSFGISNYAGSSSLIENNSINGGSGSSWSRGIYTKDSSPTIQNNTINGGSGGLSHGIYNYNDSPTIVNNVIDGGNGIDHSVGIVSTTSSELPYLAIPIIQNNRISGGSGGFGSTGIDLYETSPVIQNNLIDGGNGGNSSHGILSVFSIPVIRNNTINGGNGGDESKGIWLFTNYSAATLFTIENNIIFTADTASVTNRCIDEGNVSLLLSNNDLFSCSTALYVNYVAAGGNCPGDSTRDCLTAIADVNSLVDATASGNVSIDPSFADIDGTDNDISTMDDNDWHLTFLSHTSVTMGGLDGGPSSLAFGYTTDRDGTTRTGNGSTGWSMGAYEYDAP